jgi:hypothetical protein
MHFILRHIISKKFPDATAQPLSKSSGGYICELLTSGAHTGTNVHFVSSCALEPTVVTLGKIMQLSEGFDLFDCHSYFAESYVDYY